MNQSEIEELERAHFLYNEGRSAMKNSDFSAAAEKFKESSDLRPHFKTYESLSECLLELGNLPRAIKYAAAAAGIGNNQFRARYILAKALAQFGETQWALDKLDEALVMKPDYKAASDFRKELLG